MTPPSCFRASSVVVLMLLGASCAAHHEGRKASAPDSGSSVTGAPTTGAMVPSPPSGGVSHALLQGLVTWANGVPVRFGTVDAWCPVGFTIRTGMTDTLGYFNIPFDLPFAPPPDSATECRVGFRSDLKEDPPFVMVPARFVRSHLNVPLTPTPPMVSPYTAAQAGQPANGEPLTVHLVAAQHFPEADQRGTGQHVVAGRGELTVFGSLPALETPTRWTVHAHRDGEEITLYILLTRFQAGTADVPHRYAAWFPRLPPGRYTVHVHTLMGPPVLDAAAALPVWTAPPVVVH